MGGGNFLLRKKFVLHQAKFLKIFGIHSSPEPMMTIATNTLSVKIFIFSEIVLTREFD